MSGFFKFPNGAVVFVRDPFYAASCNACGWQGSSEACGVDTGGDDSNVYCPKCRAAGADCGRTAEAAVDIGGQLPDGYAIVSVCDRIARKQERIHELMDEGDGFWRPCSGCQEGEDGHVSERDYPFDPTFRCQPGGGCSECGGLGVLWDDTDYDEMADSIVADMKKMEAGAAAAVELAIGLYLVSGWLPWGTDWRSDGEAPSVPLCARSLSDPEEWILCCGHVVSTATMAVWLDRGWVAEGPPTPRSGRRTVVAGPKIDEWLGERWHDLVPPDDAGPL